MANIKDLFSGKKSDKILENASQNSVGSSVESSNYLRENVKDKKFFIPQVNFSSASNFAFYGSAEKYYEDAFNYIQNEYPYDGSKKEKISWELSGTYLDRYIFENVYPRTTGYVHIGNSYSFDSQNSKGYDSTSKDEWIYFKGNNTNLPTNTVLNSNLTKQYDKLNIYNTSSYGLSNLQLEGSGGVSVEFWLNKQSFNSSNESRRQVVVDIWNSASWGTAGYGRFRVEISGTDGNVLNPNFNVELLSGTSGFSSDYVSAASPVITLSGSTLTGSWNHYALTFANTGSQMVGRLYTNGALTYTYTGGTSIGTVTGSMIGQIGSLVTSVSGAAGIARGSAKLSASLDEFRFWKTKRTSQQVGENWFTQVAGGTNTDVTFATSGSTKYSYSNPADLGVYYKFNEGIINTSSVDGQDSVVLDYAGRVANGAWTGYTVTSRNTGSAIVSASAAAFEFADPILYSSHPRVSTSLSDKKNLGKFHDVKNNSSLYGSLPSWITSDDQNKSDSALRNLTQIMSSYFDTVQLQIQSITDLKSKDYISGSDKPTPFVSRFIDGSGFITSEILSKATDLEYLDARNDKKIFEDKINELKNLIYQNIYNNLTYIYKSKGTMKSFRNLIRCFGVDNELINIRLYGDQVTYDLKENHENTVVRKRYANFHDEYNLEAVVYQQTASSNSYSRGFISSSAEMQYRGNTYEMEAIFPKDIAPGEPHYFGERLLTASLYGCHTSGAAGSTAWGSPDYGQFQVQSVRPDKRRSAAYFQLTCSNDGNGVIPKLTSSVFQDVYEGSKWNFSVRIKPKKYPLAAGVSGSDIGQYDVEFAGYNYVLDVLNNSFNVTSSISSADAQNFLKAKKRFFIGSHRTNTTGTVLQKSNVEASSLMVWADYLTSSVLQAHAKDATNFGSANPYRDAYITENGTTLGSKDVKSIPQLETLLLKWDFETVTSSDAGGNFVVQDTSIASSGSNDYTGRWGWLGPIGQYQHTGYGYGFKTNYTGSVKRNYINTLKQNPPEVLSSHDMVSLIDDQQNQLFTRDTRPENYYYAFEKSMYATISREMINVFGTIVDFNNLIGQPVNRYRLEYKDMQKLRELYFERVQNDVDLDKFVEYFKWLDSALSVMLQQLVPSSAKFSENLRTMVESHILERNKYWSKFPTLEMKVSDPEAGLFGINEMLYSGKRGISPIPNSSTDKNCLWWKERAERDGDDITSGDANVDSNRDTYRLANDFRSGSGPTLTVSRASTATTTTYEGQTFALRNFTKPYRLTVDELPTLRGGSNSPKNKNVEYTHESLKFGSSEQLSIAASSIPAEKECTDVIIPNAKEKLDAKVVNSTDTDGYLSGKDDIFAPFTLYSSSVTTGYAADVGSNFRSKTDINNYHDDVYGDDKGIPAQGPFTERHVGGRQHRHININSASTDTTLTRPEAWNLDLASNTLTITARTVTQPRATMIRDAYAKRPLNIANIGWSTSSAVAGNYRFDYEILQTSGRTINNRFFVQNEGFAPTASDTGIFSGAIDYALPRFDLTGANKSIFVERFNAPGGPEVSSRGAMDVNAEEFSVYNGLNYRNLVVREALQGWYTQHCGQFGISPTGSPGDGTLPSEHRTNPFGYDGVVAAYHKTNRNPIIRAGLSNQSGATGYDGAVSCSVNYDNWYIQHPIPQSPYQYQWITSSVTKTSCDILGFAGSHDGYGLVPFTVPSGVTSVTQSGPDWITASCWEPHPIDYECFPPGGLNHAQYAFIYNLSSDPSVYKYQLTSSTNLLKPGTAFFNNASTAPSIRGHIRNINGPFQYPSWKQIRTGETPVARYHKNNNILSVSPPSRNVILPNGSGSGRPATSFNSRMDSFKNFVEPPVTFKYKPLNSFTTNGQLRHTYGNNKCLFSQRNLPIPLGGEGSINDFLGQPNEKQGFEIYDSLVANSDYNTSFRAMIYGESIYPRGVNTGLAFSRGRTRYAETASVNNAFPPTASLSLGSNGIDRGPNERRTFWRNAYYNRNRYSTPTTEYARFNTTISNSCGNQDGAARSVWSFGEEPIVYNTPSFNAALDPVTTTTLSQSSNFAFNDGRDLGELNSANVLKIGGFFGGWTGSIDPNSYLHQLYIAPTASAMYYWLPLLGYNDFQIANNGGTYFGAYGATTAASASAIQDNCSAFNKGMKWRTHIDSGRNPFYDSYEAFAENIRGLSKTHTVIPEFRISDNMEYYVKTAGKNFRATNDKFLLLNGGKTTSSAETNFSNPRQFNNDFFKDYSFSDFQKYFGKFSTNYDLGSVSLKCNAVKKLLPYKGFYPSERSLQMVTLFSGALGTSLSGGAISGAVGNDRPDRVQSGSSQLALQSLLQPWFAPGILYNTIKSGIAVDWPIFTGSSAVSNGDFITSSANTRFPFQSLLQPLEYIPVSKSDGGLGNHKMFLLGSSYNLLYSSFEEPVRKPFCEFVTRPPENVLDLYSSAMHNYLAEIPNFFLKKQELSSIETLPQGSIEIEEDAVYVMDVYVEKTNTAPDNELIMIQDYWNGYRSSSLDTMASTDFRFTPGTVFGSPQNNTRTTGSYNGKYFGPMFDAAAKTYGGAQVGWNAASIPLRKYDPAFAPCTPPYFYGKAKVRLIYTGSAEDAETKFGGKGVRWQNIINKMTMSFKPKDDGRHDIFRKINASDTRHYQSSSAWMNMMDVTASLNLKGIFTQDPTDQSLNRWVISPYMETPVLDFSSSQEAEYGYGKGMWSGYGEIPKNNKGIFYGIERSPDEFLNRTNVRDMTQWFSSTPPPPFSSETRTDSRGRTVATTEPSTVGGSVKKQVGQIADNKVISEAIVAIPFCNRKITAASGFAKTVHTKIMGKNFFTLSGVSKSKSREMFINPFDSRSIPLLRDLMTKYVLPPELDFNKYSDIEPFVMYMMEFEHKLSQDELKDIWQGVMPDIAMIPELDQKAFTHYMSENEFFGGRPLPSDDQIRWMVFKVKRRAAMNYYSTTRDSYDTPESFQQNRIFPQGRLEDKFLNPINGMDGYSYNWPYDYFSLVELAQIDVENEFVKRPPPTLAERTQPLEINDPTDGLIENIQADTSNDYTGPGAPGTVGGRITAGTFSQPSTGLASRTENSLRIASRGSITDGGNTGGSNNGSSGGGGYGFST